ncbi:unnamed protein product [Rotaria sp. Silwood2]|nr:unnamed protein product [Rotaria sp. Silwood2]
MDSSGNLLIFNPTPPGFYPSIRATRSIPFITFPEHCPLGMYKDQTGINDCMLCPTGTKNSGNATIQCTPCASGAFCPLGSVSEISQSALNTIEQAIAYPKSSDTTIFDEILIQNMFHIGSGRCLLVSPLFWTLIVVGLALLVVIIMGMLKFFIRHHTCAQIRKRIQWIFKKTDLIREGELWVGGLISFSIVVLVSFAYAFSNAYLKQYPIETSTDSYFACDLSIRNAKFQTHLQTLAIPPPETERKMFDLLNEQSLLLNVDFINTFINCDVVSIQALFSNIWSTIRWSNCQNIDSILSLSIPLPHQHISVEITLAQVQTIGALRIGVSGDKHEEDSYKLQELNFYGSFSKNGSVLAQILPVSLTLTKVINETLSMKGEKSNFSGIYIPTYTIDLNNLFISRDQYIRSTSQAIILSIVLSETPYYVKNQQQPIAKQPEIIFHNVLFTVVCLEIFGLIFILYKLIFKTIYHSICWVVFRHHEKSKKNGEEMNSDFKYSNTWSNTSDVDEHPITDVF